MKSAEERLKWQAQSIQSLNKRLNEQDRAYAELADRVEALETLQEEVMRLRNEAAAQKMSYKPRGIFGSVFGGK